MPGKNDIVAGIRLEGEKEFKSGVTDINKSIATMKSELGKVTEEYDGRANSLEALTVSLKCTIVLVRGCSMPMCQLLQNIQTSRP